MKVHSPAYILIDIDYFPQATDFFGIDKIPTLSVWLDHEEFVKIEGLVGVYSKNIFLRDYVRIQ